MVLVVIFFDSEEDVVCIVNDMDFGLVVVVWIVDFSCVYWMVCVIKVGVVYVNIYGGVDVIVFLGGVK